MRVHARSHDSHIADMFEAIRAIISGRTTEDTDDNSVGVDPVHVAACALLLDIAHADGEFSAPERAHLEEVLARHFGLDAETGARLLAIAHEERAQAVDHFRFTSVLLRNYDIGQKVVLAEVMWGLVLADGEVADHEQYLARKISNLLDLPAAYLSSAKAAAERAKQRGTE
jgi:uncharacterized tellurite resistance protein B-like protein